MMEGYGYSGAVYRLDSDFLERMSVIRFSRALFSLLQIWLVLAIFILAGISLFERSFFWYLYPFLIFFIAGRQGALLQILHEAVHSHLLRSPICNQLLGKWLAALPIGLSYETYRKNHATHHAYTNVADPREDSEKYRIVDCRNFRLYLLFLKDLSGISAIEGFLTSLEKPKVHVDPLKLKITSRIPMVFRHLFQLIFVQLFILMIFFKFDLLTYFLFWVFPILGPHMFLMRVRGIAEHGLAKQLRVDVRSPGEGTFYTRSFLTQTKRYRFLPLVWLEKALIGSLSVHYHHEHHLFPRIPFYNLKKLHENIASRVFGLNPEIYEKGYFSAAFRTGHLK